MTPKKYKNYISYKNINNYYIIEGSYHDAFQAVLFDTSFDNNLKLYCNNTVINPKSVEKITNNDYGSPMTGYQYIFNLKIEGTDCTLK